MIVPLLPLYQDRIGFSNGTFTALFSIYGAAFLAPQLFLGTISDQLGRKPVVVSAYLIVAAGTILHFLATDTLWLLFLARALHGVATGAFLGNMTAYVMDLGPHERRESASRKAGLVHTAGFALGPVVAGALSEVLGHSLRAPWVLHMALLAPGLLVLLSLPETVQVRKITRLRPRLGLPRETYRPFFLFSAPAGFAVIALGTLGVGTLPLFMRQELGLTSTFSAGLPPGILVGLSAAAQLRTEDRHPAKTARIGLILLGSGLPVAAAASYVGFNPLLFIGAGVLGVGNGLAFGSTLALAAKAAPPTARGSVMSTYFVVSYAGYVAPLLYGYLSLSLGVRDLFMGFALAFGFFAWLVGTVGLHASGLVSRPRDDEELAPAGGGGAT